MTSSFVAYVDESGDEGFVFRPDGTGSSRWFVLAAVVVRRENDRMLVDCLKTVRVVLHKKPRTPLHFSDLKHEQRVPYIRRVGELPIRVVGVMIYKPLIAEPEKFGHESFRLYRYATRLLLERVSWLCRDHHRPGDGDGCVDIVFSKRTSMSYEKIREYLRLLGRQAESDPQLVQIDRGAIDPERIVAVGHDKLAGLQVADAVASALYFAVRVNRYGEPEPAYLAHIGRALYRRKGVVLGYGIKVWPETLDAIKARAPEASILEGL